MNNVMSAADYWATPKKEKAPAGTEAIKDSNHVEQIITAAQKIGNPGFFHTFGAALLDGGYLILPIKPGEKRPALNKWQDSRLGAGDLPHYPAHGVGVLCGQGAQPIAAIDVDTLDSGLARRFTAWCCDHLGLTCERIGNAPKVLLPYRAAAEGWSKATGAWFVDLAGNQHRLEVLGKGQQFVAYHIHPDTGRPYEWVDLLGGLEATHASDLPVISEAQVKEALQVFEQMAEEAGLVRVAGSASKVGAGQTAGTVDDPLMAYEPVLGLTAEQIAEALDVMDPDLGHDDWLHVGMGLHHETAGDGFTHWDEWSAKGSKYPGEDELRKRWDSFGSTSGRPVTARSLVKLANKNGAHINLEDPAAFMATTKPGESLRFQVVPAGEFSRGKRPGWIIKGVIPLAELVVLFGESGSGKSFLALDIGAAIARGIAWRGHRTRQGRVVYIAAEGGGGFRNRLAAYQQHHGCNLDEIPFGIIHAAPNFLQKADAQDITKAIMAGGKADVIIVDTFAQVIPGANENAAEDIGKALAHCKGIHRTTGAVVVLVHHAGKDPTKGARGWSGLRAAADAEIEVTRSVAGRKVRISKQKDGDDGKEWGFDLEVVPIGIDEDGDVIDSCIVKEAEVPVASSIDPKRRLGRWEKLVLDAISEIALGQNAGIEVDAVLTEAVRRSPPAEAGGRDTRKQLARRALLTLCKGDEAPFFLEDGCLSVM